MLRLVQREMGCENARLEIGGDPPDSAEVLCAQLQDGFRLVVLFAEPPSDRPRANLRLKQLAESFFDSPIEAPIARADAEEHLVKRRLDDELYQLTARIGAAGALILDLKSPVIWASSDGQLGGEDFDEARQTGELVREAARQGVDLSVIGGLVPEERETVLESFGSETRARMERLFARLSGRSLKARRAHLLRAQTIAALREWTESAEGPSQSAFVRRVIHGDGLGYLVRSFAGIYLLVVYFPGAFSELHVEAAALHALPTIEGLVLSLPPIDPPPSRGKVLQLPRRS